MISIKLDRHGSEPLNRQIATVIRQAVISGSLAPGERLSATRTLAQDLGVHRNTVISAYRKLELEGFLLSTVGAGTFVSQTPPLPEETDSGTRNEASHNGSESIDSTPAPAEDGEHLFSWRRLLSHPDGLDPASTGLSRIGDIQVPRDPILLTGAVPDRRQFPMDEFTTCARKILSGVDPTILEYGSPEGYEPLREWIQEWLSTTGIGGIDLSRIFIVNGSQQGLDLLARLFLIPGDRVLIEEPTYSGACLILRQTGARMLGVPMDDSGLSVAAVENHLNQSNIKFLYTMPAYQNPTGICLSKKRRHALLQLARRRHLAIVEDHYDTPLYYSGEQPRSLLADEPDGTVIHLGTFSKILFPGLRLGWMIVPTELAESLGQLKRATDLSTGLLSQRVMVEFCCSGHLGGHLKRLRRINRSRLETMLEALTRSFPDEVTWTIPTGGMTLWVKLPKTIDVLELYRSAAYRGVLFTPGTAFYPNGGGRHALRLSFNRENEKRIQQGVSLLGELIKEHMLNRGGDLHTHDDAVPFL